MSRSTLLSVRNLSRRFSPSGPAAVEDLSIDLGAGEILALIGPSGCGKTTTLRMIAGFETPDTGNILVSGGDVTAAPSEKRGIGMVFQDYALFPHMTVGENILFGARRRSRDTLERYLGMVGLSGFEARYPDQLSGGQQQRVALARSFASEPRLLLLDEPFSNLDAALRSTTRREIRQLLKSAGVGIVFVTHDQEEALSFADRIAVMRDGRILQSGTAEEVYDRPVDAFVATFLGRTNLLEAKADGAFAETPFGAVPLSEALSGPVSLSLRPERLGIRPADENHPANARIAAVEFKGHDMTYIVACGGLQLQVDAMHPVRLKEGTDVHLSVGGEAVPLRRHGL